jgi:hypothetical protein
MRKRSLAIYKKKWCNHYTLMSLHLNWMTPCHGGSYYYLSKLGGSGWVPNRPELSDRNCIVLPHAKISTVRQLGCWPSSFLLRIGSRGTVRPERQVESATRGVRRPNRWAGWPADCKNELKPGAIKVETRFSVNFGTISDYSGQKNIHNFFEITIETDRFGLP